MTLPQPTRYVPEPIPILQAPPLARPQPFRFTEPAPPLAAPTPAPSNGSATDCTTNESSTAGSELREENYDSPYGVNPTKMDTSDNENEQAGSCTNINNPVVQLVVPDIVVKHKQFQVVLVENPD